MYKKCIGGYGTKLGAKHNPWLKHVRAVRKEIGMDIPYKEVLIVASVSYKKRKNIKGSKKRKVIKKKSISKKQLAFHKALIKERNQRQKRFLKK